MVAAEDSDVQEWLAKVPTDLLRAEVGRRNSAARKVHTGGGRIVLRECPHCKALFGSRAMLRHKPRCPSRLEVA